MVQHNSMPEHFQVKSRIIDPLEILWPEYEIEVIDWADYRFRITIPKEEAIPVFMEQMWSVDYIFNIIYIYISFDQFAYVQLQKKRESVKGLERK